MAVRKRFGAKDRVKAFGFGLLFIGMAVQVLEMPDFGWNAAAAFVLGFLGLGGIFRGVAGWDQV